MFLNTVHIRSIKNLSISLSSLFYCLRHSLDIVLTFLALNTKHFRRHSCYVCRTPCTRSRLINSVNSNPTWTRLENNLPNRMCTAFSIFNNPFTSWSVIRNNFNISSSSSTSLLYSLLSTNSSRWCINLHHDSRVKFFNNISHSQPTRR